MRRPRKFAIVPTLLALALAGPAMAQNLGFFEGPANNGTTATGAVGLTGWVLSDVGVRRVIIQVDGLDIAQANYGRPRPGVEALHPGFPDSAAAGFSYILNATDYLDGPHQVSARAELMNGTFYDIGPTRTLQFANESHNLRPFGDIERPDRNANLVGTCDLSAPFRRLVVVEGWALDLGDDSDTTRDEGIGFVELLVDGTFIARSTTDCRFSLAEGGFTDCYGLRRLDIEQKYPFAVDAPNAGFRFVMDIGLLRNIGYAAGHHTLGVRAGDEGDQREIIDEIPVTFVCAENIGNEPAFGRIESPKFNRFYDGLVRAEGWALDPEGIERIDLYVDGEYIRSVALSPTLTRPSVSMTYPGFPDSANPVFRAFFDTTGLADGIRQLQVVVVDKLGEESSIGEVSFVLDNIRDE